MPALVFKIYDVGYDTRKNKIRKKHGYCAALILAATMTPKKKKIVTLDFLIISVCHAALFEF